MTISSKHILSQGPALRALLQVALVSVRQQILKPQAKDVTVPGPESHYTFKPRPRNLINDYIEHVGGNPENYPNTLPPHFFAQWGFPVMSQTVRGLPYPLIKAVNGGCRLCINRPLPSDEPLHVRSRLENIDDNGSRVVIHQRLTTGTDSTPDAIVTDSYVIVPLGRKGTGKKKPKPHVPSRAKELGNWQLGPKAGLDFAKLTGDFNPIHWVPLHAKASGFKNTILHGFSAMARSIETLMHTELAGSGHPTVFDAQFTRPLVLPARVGLYLGPDNTVYVGDAPGEPAYMVGTFTL